MGKYLGFKQEFVSNHATSTGMSLHALAPCPICVSGGKCNGWATDPNDGSRRYIEYLAGGKI